MIFIMIACILNLQEVLGHLEQLEESEREYVACMRTSATVNHAAPNAAVVPERGMQAANAPEAWQDRCESFCYLSDAPAEQLFSAVVYSIGFGLLQEPNPIDSLGVLNGSFHL